MEILTYSPLKIKVVPVLVNNLLFLAFYCTSIDVTYSHVLLH